VRGPRGGQQGGGGGGGGGVAATVLLRAGGWRRAKNHGGDGALGRVGGLGRCRGAQNIYRRERRGPARVAGAQREAFVKRGRFSPPGRPPQASLPCAGKGDWPAILTKRGGVARWGGAGGGGSAPSAGGARSGESYAEKKKGGPEAAPLSRNKRGPTTTFRRGGERRPKPRGGPGAPVPGGVAPPPGGGGSSYPPGWSKEGWVTRGEVFLEKKRFSRGLRRGGDQRGRTAAGGGAGPRRVSPGGGGGRGSRGGAARGAGEGPFSRGGRRGELRRGAAAGKRAPFSGGPGPMAPSRGGAGAPLAAGELEPSQKGPPGGGGQEVTRTSGGAVGGTGLPRASARRGRGRGGGPGNGGGGGQAGGPGAEGGGPAGGRNRGPAGDRGGGGDADGPGPRSAGREPLRGRGAKAMGWGAARHYSATGKRGPHPEGGGPQTPNLERAGLEGGTRASGCPPGKTSAFFSGGRSKKKQKKFKKTRRWDVFFFAGKSAWGGRAPAGWKAALLNGWGPPEGMGPSAPLSAVFSSGSTSLRPVSGGMTEKNNGFFFR